MTSVYAELKSIKSCAGLHITFFVAYFNILFHFCHYSLDYCTSFVSFVLKLAPCPLINSMAGLNFFSLAFQTFLFWTI